MRSTIKITIAGVTIAPLVAVPAFSAEAAITPAPAAPTAAAPAAPAAVAAKAPSVAARSAYLWDSGAKKTRWTKSPDTRRPVASITKVMTAMVVLRGGHLDRKITVKKKHVDYARTHGASSAKLRAGDKLTVRQLLNAMMLPSGCDAAYVLADSYGPGWRGFVAKMNKTAKQLKMTRTHYANFDGLPWPSQTSTLSTARDQIKLGHYAMKNKDFRAVVARKSYSLGSGGGHHAYRWTNTNLLIGSYRGTIGIKTGFTDGAGYSLMFAAHRGKRTLIGVVLNSSTTKPGARFTDAARLLSWGFGVRTAEVYRVPPVPAGANID